MNPTPSSPAIFSPLFAILGLVVLVVLIGFFIVSLVRYFSTRKGGWLAGAIVSLLLGLGLVGVGAAMGVKAIQAANHKPPYKVATSGGTLSAQIPGDWKDMPTINPVASLRVGNEKRGEFFIVITEKREEGESEGLIEEYAELTANNMKKGLTNGEITPPKEVTVNGRRGIQRVISGKLKGTNLVYLHTYVETPTEYHQLLMWTIGSRKDVVMPVFEEVISSIKLDEKK